MLEIIDDETLIVIWENAIESKMIDMDELNTLRKYLVDHYPRKDDNNHLFFINKKDIEII